MLKRCVALAGSARCGCCNGLQPLAWCPLPSILLSSAFDACVFSPSDLHLWQGNCSGAGFSASGQGDMVSVSFLVVPTLVAPWRGIRSFLRGVKL